MFCAQLVLILVTLGQRDLCNVRCRISTDWWTVERRIRIWRLRQNRAIDNFSFVTAEQRFHSHIYSTCVSVLRVTSSVTLSGLCPYSLLSLKSRTGVSDTEVLSHETAAVVYFQQLRMLLNYVLSFGGL